MRVANLAVIQLFTDDIMAANTPKVVSFGFKNLSVPASSAPIERVFSHGGIIMRPHRARLGDTMLSKLIFLKCNNLYEIQSQ